MPLYRFYCSSCSKEFSRICPPGIVETPCVDCGAISPKLPSRINAPTVFVTLDKQKKKKVIRNINQIMRDRARHHTLNYEVGEIVEKQGLKNTIRATTFFDKKTGKLKKK